MDGGSDWASTLLVILIMVSFLLNFTDIPQKIQMLRYSSYIRKRIVQLTEIEDEGRKKTLKYLNKLGVKNPKKVIDGFVDNFFMISPVDIEPTDIIKRLRHLVRNRDESVRTYVMENMPGLDLVQMQNAEVMLEVASILSQITKIVKHYYQIGVKYNNWVFMMQLALELQQIVKLAKTYGDALDAFAMGTPIGDGVGPMVARELALKAEPKEIVKETVVYETELDKRKLYVIKAKGPGSTVGWPGEAVEKVVEELGGKVDRIITVDAALKLESEPSGVAAYGVGAAIGDIGPEKIAIERTAMKYSIPLDAVVVKISNEEAINTMNKQVYEGVMKALKIVKDIIRNKVEEGGKVVVVGIGNTIGID